MSASDVVFWAFAVVTVGSAAVVVLSRTLIYSAFSLLFTFFGVAGLYVLLGADFLAAAQLLIYVGGILVLLLFGVMLTHKIYDLDLRTGTTQMAPGAIVAAGLFVILAATAVRQRVGGHGASAGPDHDRDRPAVHGPVPAGVRGRLGAAARGAHRRGDDRAPPQGRDRPLPCTRRRRLSLGVRLLAAARGDVLMNIEPC